MSATRTTRWWSAALGGGLLTLSLMACGETPTPSTSSSTSSTTSPATSTGTPGTPGAAGPEAVAPAPGTPAPAPGTAASGAPAGYTFCATEGQQCKFTGTAKVSYGANGKFTTLTKTGGTPCTNAVFGDPLVGTLKACYTQATTATPAPSRNRPRIFMSLHGSNRLANDASLDSQWTYVRENLDGIWGNNADVDFDTEARLFKKIKTRDLITEWPVPGDATSPWVGVGIFSGAQDKYPELVINREAIALYADPPSQWNGRTIASAEAEYVNNAKEQARKLYKSVYTGWQPFRFATPLTGDALKAFNDSKGVLIECPGAVCTVDQDVNKNKTGFINALKAAHAQNKPFIWFNSRLNTPGWLAETQRMYKMIADMGLWRPTDVIMIINYNDKYAAVPETVNGQPADTTTGILYWLLKQ